LSKPRTVFFVKFVYVSEGLAFAGFWDKNKKIEIVFKEI